MDQRRDNLLPIGSFARAARLSLKAMRLYAELGLLHVDRFSLGIANLLSILTRLLARQINLQLLNQDPKTGGEWE